MDMANNNFEPAEAGTHVDAQLADAAESWLDKYSVVAKVRTAIFGNILIIITILAIVIGSASYLGSKAITQGDKASTSELMSDANTALSEARFHLSEFDKSRDLTALRSAQTELDRAFTNYGLLTQDDHPFSEAIQSGNTSRLEEIGAIRELLSNLEQPLTSDAEVPAAQQRTADVLESSRTEFDKVVEVVAVDFADLLAEITVLVWFVAISGVVLLAGAIWGGRQVARNIIGMIGSVTSATKRIADGYSDTRIPGQQRGDELGDMARALVVFRDASQELQQLNDQRAQAAEKELFQQQNLAEQSNRMQVEKMELLNGLADGFEFSNGVVIAEVGGAAEQLKTTSQSMVALAESSSQQSLEATDAMLEATKNVSAAAAATDQFALSIAEVSSQATKSASLARDASELVVTANDKMTDLSGAADEIGEIAELIQSIAQRTNLLALNASIEAARGGEAGRGFAVVASEVKELASQTSNATSSVAAKISAMQSSTGSSVSDLTSIVSQINELEQSSMMIAEAVGQQSHAAGELARNIDSVAHSTAHVEGQLEQLHKASLMTGSAASQVQTSAQELGAHAVAMRDKADEFLTTVRRSASDLNSKEIEL